MARGRRSGDELPALELETWSAPAPAGVATERSGLGAAAWAVLLLGLAAFSVFVLAGGAHPDAESAVAVGPPASGADRSAPGVGMVAEPLQFVGRTATLMPPGRARPVLSSAELLSRVGTSPGSAQVELSFGRYSELMRGSQTVDHLVWVVVEKSPLTNRVRIFDAVDGAALVEFASPPGMAICPLEIGESVDHCASMLQSTRRLVLWNLTTPHQF